MNIFNSKKKYMFIKRTAQNFAFSVNSALSFIYKLSSNHALTGY